MNKNDSKRWPNEALHRANVGATESCVLGTHIREATQRLNDSGVHSARIDAEILAAHVLGISRADLQLRISTREAFTASQVRAFDELIQQRSSRVPVQHLTATATFRTVELAVGPGVFIPRPETEHVVTIAMTELDRLLKNRLSNATLGNIPLLNTGLGNRAQGAEASTRPKVIDLGTGSGAIAAALATEYDGAYTARPVEASGYPLDVHAVEFSELALAWAQQNLQNLSVTLHQGDLRQPQPQWGTRFDVVISNPPYIPANMVPQDIEVALHDPELALYGGGENGLELPMAVFDTASHILAPGGWVICEHAETQAEAMLAYCANHPEFTDVVSHTDLTGRPRATSARRIAQIIDKTP